jgi:glycogen(starch) synthase
MIILFVSNEYPPDTGFGGIGTYTLHAAEGLAARGHRIHVICRGVSDKNETIICNGVTLHRVIPGPYTLPSTRLFFPFRMICYRTIPQSLVRLAWAKTVERTIADLRNAGLLFDLIEYPECGAEGFYVKQATGATIVRLHTPWSLIHKFDDLGGPGADRILQEYLEKGATRKATAITAPSQALAALLKKRWRLPQVTVYPNPLPAGSFPQTKGGGWIYSGRIERRKGIDVLLRAYARLCAEHTAPPLMLLGRSYGRLKNSEEYGNYIRSLIANPALSEKVTWIPGVPQYDVATYLSRSSVAFFPSLWENFPYACLEAMACGCAVVASRCGGFPEMIDDGLSGILVEPGAETALYGAMLRLLQEPALVTKLGAAARVRVASCFDRESVCERAEGFYRSLCRESSHE